MADILREREKSVFRKGQEASFQIDCEKQSVAGSVSQRACVFCGSRVVLYPIADAVHIVHGPIGCASYTWDIRGALSSGPELHRLSRYRQSRLRQNHHQRVLPEKRRFASHVRPGEQHQPPCR